MSPWKALVSTADLHARLQAGVKEGSHLLILDVAFVADRSRNAYEDIYKKEHIPGAKFFDLHACVSGSELIPRNIPNVYPFIKLMRSLGAGKDTEVVVYDHGAPEAAARAWWTFRLFGHEKVSVLDGGLKKWIADGYDVTSGDTPAETTSDFELNFRADLIRDLDDIRRELASGTAQILDTRAEHFFTGAKSHSEKLPGGHIPGSLNVPLKTLFNENGTYKSVEDLRQVIQERGVSLERPLVSTCRTGMTACCLAVATHLLGNEDVPVYYGSWMEWAQTEGTQGERICT